MVVAQAMMTCIDSGWNSTTGANIYHKHVSPDDSYFNVRNVSLWRARLRLWPFYRIGEAWYALTPAYFMHERSTLVVVMHAAVVTTRS